MGYLDGRIGWRLLAREPGYSLAVIGGLAVGFAACFLLLGFVIHSLGYNAQLPASERTYLVKERRNLLPRPEWRASAPGALRDVVGASGMAAAFTQSHSVELTARVGQRVLPLTVSAVEPNYLAFFGVTALQGDASAALARPDALVLSESEALRLFGRRDAIGQVARIDGVPFQVRAIVPDMPGNTTVRADALVGAGIHGWDRGKAPAQAWNSNTELYVRLAPGADPGAINAVLQEAVVRHRDAPAMTAALRQRFAGRHMTEIGMTALSALYFDEGLLAGRDGASYGNIKSLAALGALALLILALAGANYVNLVAVRMVDRRREIGMRKAMGVSAPALARQFVAESMVVALLASALGVALAWLAAPQFAMLVERPLDGMFGPSMLGAALLAGGAVGALSALYPASVALRLPVREMLQGRAGGQDAGGLRLRQALSVFQFACAIGLVGATGAVYWQADYASRVDPGFDPASLLVLDLPTADAPAQAFREALARLPGVGGVVAVADAVGRDTVVATASVGRAGGAEVALEVKGVGPEFFQVLGVRAQLGRVFDPARDRPGSGSVVLNALAAQALGFATPREALGAMLGKERVVGIVPDLRYRTLREHPGPMMYRIDPLQTVLMVRTTSGKAALHGAIETLWQRYYPDQVLYLEPAAAIFAQNYGEDRRLALMLAGASVVATALASFGIYVLAAYSIRRRAREIVLRKLHGAGGAAIGRLVAREFAALAGIGAALGLPLAWLANERYLSGFVERAPMGQWPLVCAAGGVFAVALAATARHTIGAMRMAPAAALRG
ncbi:FtsX-like permease family protein [Massilia atriviolacea]|uniref:FtsX-like permease family protein n=1 Tax=Massilia atriviolacea TaxID=2495579 RepID=A0A430HRU7_9BURK|nr:ABC transporter permease [Massilia atriviolacea]RSZ60251.1 FtsX-like permease family protein [Massilia atriviolacea]